MGRTHSFATTAFISDFPSASLQAFTKQHASMSFWDATLSMTVHWYQDPSVLHEGKNAGHEESQWLQLRIVSRMLSLDRHEYQVAMWNVEGSLVCTSSQLQIMKITSKH